MRTLVMLPNWVGDTVMAEPVLERLAASGREVHALGKPHLIPLLRLMPQLAGILGRGETDSETIGGIRRAEVEEVVLLPNSFRAAWLARRAGIERRWGYAGDFRRLLLRPAVRRPRGRRHQLNDYDRLLETMRVEPVGERLPRLEPAPRHRDAARRSLASAGPAGARLIGLFPGSALGPSKRWPAARFAELARRLSGLEEGCVPVLVVGPGEEELAGSIAAGASRPLPIVGPDLDLAQLAAVLERLALLVTNDSGPMHLAAAVGTPCVALFGPTDPLRTAPQGPAHRIVWTSRWCSPCFRRRCPLLHHRCLRDIGVEEVLEACGYSIS